MPERSGVIAGNITLSMPNSIYFLQFVDTRIMCSWLPVALFVVLIFHLWCVSLNMRRISRFPYLKVVLKSLFTKACNVYIIC